MSPSHLCFTLGISTMIYGLGFVDGSVMGFGDSCFSLLLRARASSGGCYYSCSLMLCFLPLAFRLALFFLLLEFQIKLKEIEELREAVEKEMQIYEAMVRLEDMHEVYAKQSRAAEERLIGVCE